ncbi:MAG: hypothetical protein ABI960_03585 [Candidatus Eisenbacteria bacterium]
MRAAWTVGRAVAGLVAGLVLLVPAAPVSAQVAGDVQRALDVTQGVIDRASTTLDCPPDEDRLPCVYLGQARSLQSSARASFGSGFLRDALALTLRARDRAYSALRVGQDATGGEFLRFSLERTDALLDRVAPIVRESGVDAAMRLLDVAFDAQRRAKQAALDGRPRVALSGTYQARERALTALRLAEGNRGATPDGARAILERTDDLLRDGAWLADAGASAAPYARAIALQERAHARLDAGDSGRAAALSQAARDALTQAFTRADRPLQRAAVERELSANASALERAHARVGDDAERKRHLDRAEEHHRRAQDHLREGRFAPALSELRASKEALSRLGL